jgi:hypothetical protein
LIVNPLQLIPPVVAAAVCAPLATVLFNFRATYTVGGLGLNSFIAPIYFWGQSTGSFCNLRCLRNGTASIDLSRWLPDHEKDEAGTRWRDAFDGSLSKKQLLVWKAGRGVIFLFKYDKN